MGWFCDIFTHDFEEIDFSPLPESKTYFCRLFCRRCLDFGFAEYEKRKDGWFVRITRIRF